jgi:hypothetical protein
LQRVLMIAHSNQALNDLFEKILERDIAEHHLLRLGELWWGRQWRWRRAFLHSATSSSCAFTLRP